MYLTAKISASHIGISSFVPAFISELSFPSRYPNPGTSTSKVHGIFYTDEDRLDVGIRVSLPLEPKTNSLGGNVWNCRPPEF